MNRSETPQWLEDDGEGSAPASITVGDPQDPSSPGDKTKQSLSSRFRSCCFGGCIFLSIISLAFFGVFVYAAIVQSNDPDGLQWEIYYALNAVVPGLFLIYYICCFPVMAIHAMSLITASWSIVYIVIYSLKVQNMSTGSRFLQDAFGNETLAMGNIGNETIEEDEILDEIDTEEIDNQDEMEEYIFELTGASIGLFSSLYHSFMVKCCVAKTDKNSDEYQNPSEQNDLQLTDDPDL